jgi:hypothetical protein
MNTWAVLAAKLAAVASGVGAGGIIPVFGAGSLEGFTIGALMSGTCILVFTSPRRNRRRNPAAAAGGRRLAAAGGRDQARGLDQAGGLDQAARGLDQPGAGDEPQIATQPQAPDDTRTTGRERQDRLEPDGYRSRHRLSDQDASPRRAGTRRSTPRHAAPPASFGGRMTSRVAVLALASGARS